MAFQSTIDVHMILRRPDGTVLLAERKGGYASGQLNVPGGKLEAGEDVVTAAIREAAEEIGVKIHHEDVHAVSVVHHRNPEGETRVGFFFETTTWVGEPVNAEPEKCAGILWANPHHLPDNTIPYTAAGLATGEKSHMVRLHGWSDQADLTFLDGRQ